MEFNQPIYRDANGTLLINDLTESLNAAKGTTWTVGELLEQLVDGIEDDLSFGGSEDALTLKEVVDYGDWVSIEFDQRVFRDNNGRFVVEERLNGQEVKTTFPTAVEASMLDLKKNGDSKPTEDPNAQ